MLGANMVHYEFGRRLCRFALLLAAICLVPGLTSAADHYVCAAATGTADGSSWTNAYTDLPASFVRGDTYWVAAGSYGSHTFSTTASGTSVITIKAATDSSHGSNSTGWTSSGTGTCHQGQAKFTPASGSTAAPWNITTSYWTFDGSYRGTWNDPTSYGFYVNNNNNGVPYNAVQAISVSGGPSNLTFKYLVVKGSDGGTGQDQCIWFQANGNGNQNDYVGYTLFDTPGVQALRLSSVQNFISEYNWMRNNGSAGGHSEMIAINEGGSPGNGKGPANSNISIRYNYIENSQGAGNISTPCGCSSPGFSGYFDIYGNVFFANLAEANSKTSAKIGAWDSVIFLNGSAIGGNMHVYNNTIVGLPSNNSADMVNWGNGASLTGGGTMAIENNLWYSNTHVSEFTGAGITWDYQSYFSQNNVTDGSAHIQCPGGSSNCAGGNPFVNVVINTQGRDDFHLTFDTATWTPLPPPYNVDMDGVVRTSSRGAFQFTGASSTAPAPPTGLTATIH
jgi:hypothetical protein